MPRERALLQQTSDEHCPINRRPTNAAGYVYATKRIRNRNTLISGQRMTPKPPQADGGGSNTAPPPFGVYSLSNGSTRTTRNCPV